MNLPKHIFGLDAAVQRTAELRGYPNVYTTAYRCSTAAIGGVQCIVVEPRGEVKPLQIEKMFAALSSGEGLPCLLVCAKLSARQRRSLSERGIAWLAGEETFHIPFLAASCAPSRPGARGAETLSAGAQQVAIRAIDGSWDGMTTTEVAKAMNKSLTSASSYFAEVSAVEPSLIGARGRTRFIASPKTASDKESVFDRFGPHLASPVKRRLYLVCGTKAQAQISRLPRSGVTALSSHTMLAEDPWETRAIAATNKESLASLLEDAEQVGIYDTPDVLLEVWSYEPEESDLISLYLDMRDYASAQHDERLEAAATELKEMMFDER